MKCEICGNEIRRTLLGKIVGTVIYDEKGKKHYICNECQSKYSKEEILKLLSKNKK